MIKCKEQIGSLIRREAKDFSRSEYLRLDMNESVSGLPASFLRKAFCGVTPDFVAAYPEYQDIVGKISVHNGIRKENICLSNGSDAAIKYIFDAYISAGDRVLLTDPTFAMYPVYCSMFKARPLYVKYVSDFNFPLQEFLKKINPGLKMLILVNPNNPTGSALSQKYILEIVKKAQMCGVLAIVDEAYFYFYKKTVIKEINKFNNLIVLRTFSKLCGMANLRLGYAAANPGIVENLRKVRPTYDVNGIAVLLAGKILASGRLLNKLVDETKKGKEYLISKLEENRIEYRNGHANFVLVKCRNIDRIVSGLKNDKILVVSGFSQKFLSNYIRVTVGDERIMKAFWGIFIKHWRKNA